MTRILGLTRSVLCCSFFSFRISTNCIPRPYHPRQTVACSRVGLQKYTNTVRLRNLGSSVMANTRQGTTPTTYRGEQGRKLKRYVQNNTAAGCRKLYTTATLTDSSKIKDSTDNQTELLDGADPAHTDDLDKLFDLIDDLCVPMAKDKSWDQGISLHDTALEGAMNPAEGAVDILKNKNKSLKVNTGDSNARSSSEKLESRLATIDDNLAPLKGGKKMRRAIEGAITFALRDKNLDRAAMLLDKANHRNIRLSQRTCREAMRRYYQAQRHEDVLRVEITIEREKMPCDTEMYLYRLEAHSRNQNWAQNISLLDEMTNLNVPRNDRIFLAVSKTCLAAKERHKMFTTLQRSILEPAGMDVLVPKYLINKGATMGEVDVCDTLYEYMVHAYYRRNWKNLKHDGLLDLHAHTTAMAEAAVRRVLRLMLNRRYKSTKGLLWELQTPQQHARNKMYADGEGEHIGLTIKDDKERYHPFDAFVVGTPRASSPPSQKSLRTAVENYLTHDVSPPIGTYTPKGKTGHLAMDADDLARWLARQ